MGWAERIIHRPRLVIAGVMVIGLVSIAAVLTLPRERTPRVRLPVIVVAVQNAGASAATNELLIVNAIEDHASQLDGLRKNGGVLSEAHHGAAIVQYTFSSGVDVEEARRDVETLLNQIRGELPREAQSNPGPLVKDIAFEDWPVIQILVAGGDSAETRHRVAERLKARAEQLPGVAAVDAFGDFEPEIHVEANPHLLALHGLTFQELASSVRRAIADLPSGSIESTDGMEIHVRTQGRPVDLTTLRRTPVSAGDGRPLLLQDVSTVRVGQAPRTSRARFAGKDAVVLLVRPQTDADLLATAQAAQQLVDDVAASGQAEGLVVGTGRAMTRQIHSMLQQLGSSAAWGTMIIFIVLLAFLGWRNALLIVCAVPFALLTTGAVLWIVKRTFLPDLAINNMVLFGIILVSGLVVDGCIIVGENIFRLRESGHAPLAAATRGLAEVARSLVTAYLTTLAAFIPMMMVGGVVGEFLQILPVVVLVALCSALLADHFLLPVLSVYFMRVRQGAPLECDHKQQHSTAQAPENPWLAGAPRRYAAFLRGVIHRPVRAFMAAIVLALAPIAAVASGAMGLTFFPESDIPIIEVHFELPLGSSIDRTEQVAGELERAVSRAVRPDEWYLPSPRAARSQPVTTIGEPGALNTNLDGQQGAGPEFGMIFIELENAEDRARPISAIRESILAELPRLPGVVVRVRSPSDGPPTGAPVLVRVKAREHTPLEALASRAAQVEAVLSRAVSARDVRNDHRVRPGVQVSPDREAAALYALDAEQINAAVSYALDGVRVAEIDFGGDEQLDVRVRGLAAERDALSDLVNLPLRSHTGRIATLEQVADIQRITAANVIRHYDGRRVINIRAEVAADASPDDVKEELIAALRPELTSAQRFHMLRSERTLLADSDVIIEFGGENEARDEALKDLHVALGVAVGAMMLILLAQFNSFRQTLIVMFSVPLGFAGVVLGHLAWGLPFSISSMIGVVALSGIVVNDAIVLVDFYNQSRAAGHAPQEAAIRAAQLRFRPIILTTLTTIGGLLPLSLNLWGGAEFWQPLAVAIMSGLAVATVLQLLLVPLACCTFCRSDASLAQPRLPAMGGVGRSPALPTT